jgi:hypothetical protein
MKRAGPQPQRPAHSPSHASQRAPRPPHPNEGLRTRYDLWAELVFLVISRRPRPYLWKRFPGRMPRDGRRSCLIAQGLEPLPAGCCRNDRLVEPGRKNRRPPASKAGRRQPQAGGHHRTNWKRTWGALRAQDQRPLEHLYPLRGTTRGAGAGLRTPSALGIRASTPTGAGGSGAGRGTGQGDGARHLFGPGG